jgi:hypothetical protein
LALLFWCFRPLLFVTPSRTRHQLDWHHANLRSAAAGTFQQAFLFPMLGLPVSDTLKEQSSKNLHLCLKDMDATLACACDLELCAGSL